MSSGGGSGAIRAIDQSTVKQICSGQVITSIASVVKELVENSFDAGATKIEVIVTDNGMSEVIVSDDGCGIDVAADAQEVPLLSRRASSKQGSLTNGGNTISVGQHDTLGFRGEALHSLAVVSKTRIHTRPESGAHSGVELIYNADTSETNVNVLSRPSCGTTVTVKDLFHNIPVRRRELEKSSKKQSTAVTSLLKSWSVMRPGVRVYGEFRAKQGGVTTICSTKGRGDLLAAIGDVYGGRVAGSLMPIEWECGELRITGYASKIGSGRLTADLQLFSLDGRLVEMKKWAKIVSDCFADCHPHTTTAKTPAIFMNAVSTTDRGYDVNVAPDKKSVLTHNETEILDSIRAAAKKDFQHRSDITSVGKAKTKPSREMDLVLKPISSTTPMRASLKLKEQNDTPSQPVRYIIEEVSDEGGLPNHSLSTTSLDVQWDDINVNSTQKMQQQQAKAAAEAAADELPKKRKRKQGQYSKLTSTNCEKELTDSFSRNSFSKVVVIGQFNKGFIVTEHQGDVFVLDQHASDEKFNYERLLGSFEARPQILLAPVRVEMEHEERELALEHASELRRRGFIIEADTTSCSAVMVKSVPILPYDTVSPTDIHEYTAQLLNGGRIVKQLKAVWHSVATKACRTSIMIGTSLNEQTQLKIVRNMGTMDQPWNCPHGRPTMRHVGQVPQVKPAGRKPAGVANL